MTETGTRTPRPAASSPPRRTNADQAAAWNGPEGANWADSADTGTIDDVLVGPLLAAAGIADGTELLDVGCGTGEMTRLAAQRVGDGHAVGVDLSSLMIDQARAAAAASGIANAHFELGDAQVHPFRSAAFDVAVSHFGVMFFDDPVAAFANVARALRLGGTLAFVCPQAMERCDWYTVPLAALLGHRPTRAEAPSRMFSLAEPTDVVAILRRAGFVDIRLKSEPAALRFGTDVATATRFFVGSGPVRAQLERRPELDDARARALLARALEPYLGDDGVRIPGAHWLVTAQRPAAPRLDARDAA